MARPEGDLPGASGQRRVSLIFCVSIWMSSEVSSLLTKMLPWAAANSGLPPRASRAGDGAVSPVDGGRVLAVAVGGKHAFADGVVGDSVRIAVGLYGAESLQRFKVKNGGSRKS
jgi:hypothetical protein